MTDVIKIGADYTVIGIQNSPVSSTSPTDGYVMTWNSAGGHWEPKPIPPQSSGLRKDYFTSGGNWTCPAGVTTVQLIMCGGGGGGASGSVSSTGGGSGGGAIQQYFVVSVTPGNVYPVTIGAGGAGGASVVGIGTPMSGNDGQDGYSTTFSSLATAIGGGSTYANQGGANWAGSLINETAFPSNFRMPGWGWVGASNGLRKGHQSYTGFSGGTQGSDASGPHGGGSGGGGGSAGVGGNGGNGSSSGNGSNGQDGSPNTGAGGGGGGSCPNTFTSGAGGNGGTGYLYIIY